MRVFATALTAIAMACAPVQAQDTAALDADSVRAALMAEELAMNAPGTPATDFAMELPDGSTARLSDFRGEAMLLVFFDPGCDDCMHAVAELALAAPAGLRVLAVYAEGDESVRAQAVAAVPGQWTVAFDTDGVYGAGLYSPEFIPGLYLLDSDGTVQARSSDAAEITALLLKNVK